MQKNKMWGGCCQVIKRFCVWKNNSINIAWCFCWQLLNSFLCKIYFPNTIHLFVNVNFSVWVYFRIHGSFADQNFLGMLTFSNMFSWVTIAVFLLKFQSLFPRFQLIVSKLTLVQVMLGAKQATSHYLNQWLPSVLTWYGVISPWWVKPLSDPLVAKFIDASQG